MQFFHSNFILPGFQEKLLFKGKENHRVSSQPGIPTGPRPPGPGPAGLTSAGPPGPPSCSGPGPPGAGS